MKYIVKFRCSNHKLAIETGRYVGIERNMRFCNICESNRLGDEYHIMFECPNEQVVHYRNLYLPLYFTNNHSVFKLCKLMVDLNNDRQLSIDVAKFIKNCKIL